MFLVCLSTFSCFSSPLSFVYSSSHSFHPLLISSFLFLAGFSNSIKFLNLWVCPEEMELLVKRSPARSTTKAPILEREHHRIQKGVILQEPWTSHPHTCNYTSIPCPYSQHWTCSCNIINWSTSFSITWLSSPRTGLFQHLTDYCVKQALITGLMSEWMNKFKRTFPSSTQMPTKAEHR